MKPLAKVRIEQPEEQPRAIDTRIKRFSDIDQDRLSELYDKAYELGFQGSATGRMEVVGYPGGSYVLATITFTTNNGKSENYDLGLFMAYPEITWGEMRRIGMLPRFGLPVNEEDVFGHKMID